MKKLIIILAMFLAVQGMAQNNLIELWNEKYIPYCDSLVYDTLTESGTVIYDVVSKDGDIKLIPKDTLWDEQQCKEYEINSIGFTDWQWRSGNTTYLSYTNTGALTVTAMPKIKSNEFTTDIKREKICTIKYKRPELDDFWDWLRTNKYIK